MPEPSLLQRLKERKLVQWAVAYAAGAFVVFQAVEVMADPWGISPALQRGAHILLVIGLFVTIVLAWYHGEKGRQRVSGPELLMVAALLVVAGVAVTFLSREGESASGPRSRRGSGRPAVALLPLEDHSPNPEDAYFADGVHEELTSKLSQISAIDVISRSSLEQYRDPEVRPSIPEIARDLGGVDYILEGSARVGGGMVRITVQLIDAETDVHVWTNSFTSPYEVERFILLQSDIAQEIASELQIEIAPDEQARMATISTENLEAWNLYQRAEASWVRMLDEDDAREAIGLFQGAVSVDPGFAEAWAGLARAYVWMYWNYSEDDADLAAAGEAVDRAVALDPEGVLTHHAQGFYHYYGFREYDQAMEHFRAALRAQPSFADAQARVGFLFRRMGRWDEAIAALRKAQRLDPRAVGPALGLGETLTWVGVNEEAEQFLDLARTIQPDVAYNHEMKLLYYLDGRGDTVAARHLVESLPEGITPEHRSEMAAEVAVWRGDFERALVGITRASDNEEFDAAMVHVLLADPLRSEAAADTLLPEGLDPGMRPGDLAQRGLGTSVPEYISHMAWVMLLRGEPERAREWMDEFECRLSLEKDALGGMITLVNAARLHALSGDEEGALDRLEEVLSNPSPLGSDGVRIDPSFASLRDHPRFQTLLEEYRDGVEH